MRISDWSSDVCSSDLAFSADQKSSHGFPPRRPAPEPPLPSSLRWKRKSVSKERRRYTPLEPSQDRKSTRLNSSHSCASRMPSFACKIILLFLLLSHFLP